MFVVDLQSHETVTYYRQFLIYLTCW